MDVNTVGRMVILVGIAIVALGGTLMLFSRIPFLKDLGSLPGDFRIQGDHFSCFAPIMSMIILSILLSLALNIIVRLINR
jgi:hypothetical protein